MYKLVTAEIMQQLDKMSIDEFGISSLKLMTNAGKEVFKAVANLSNNFKDKKITIICGKGNNGGDGLVVAECLLEKSIIPTVFVLSTKTSLKDDPKKIYTRILKKHPDFKVKFISKYDNNIFNDSDIIIDALFGTGFNSNPEDVFFDIIQGTNKSNAKIYSIDIPSGIHGSNGNMEDIAVKADYTITLGYPKLGLYLNDGYTCSGEVIVVDIGLPKEIDEQVQESRVLIEIKDIKNILRKREIVCSKKDYGKVFNLAGSISMPGAAILSSLAALKTGTGLLRLGIPENISSFVSITNPEIMTAPLPYTQPGFTSMIADRDVSKNSQWADAVLMGPGLSCHHETKKLIKKILSKSLLKPTLLDADALNILAEAPELLESCNKKVILTPHDGEMARLIGISKELFVLNRISHTIKKAVAWQCFIVLKGTPTIIASPDGSAHIFVNKCPALASGGTGDVLSGIIISLVGQNYDILDSIKIGLYLHKFAAEIVAEKVGEDSLMASDIIKYIPDAIMKIKALSKN